MQSIGHYFGKEVYWLDYMNFPAQFPGKDSICLAIANREFDAERFSSFVKAAIANGVLEFKGQGKFGEGLHDLFDETLVYMELIENRHKGDVITTWHHDESLADVFWQCFHADSIPDTANAEEIKVICVDLDGINRTEELKSYMREFESGRLRSDGIRHEVWQDPEGLTTLCLGDERGDDCRKLLDAGSRLLYEFYAESPFEAMTVYYSFMGWGTYSTEFEADKQPYKRETDDKP